MCTLWNCVFFRLPSLIWGFFFSHSRFLSQCIDFNILLEKQFYRRSKGTPQYVVGERNNHEAPRMHGTYDRFLCLLPYKNCDANALQIVNSYLYQVERVNFLDWPLDTNLVSNADTQFYVVKSADLTLSVLLLKNFIH